MIQHDFLVVGEDMPVMCVVVDGEKIAGSIEKVVDADDGYARSSSSGPNDEQESNFDDESDGLSSSSSGVGSSALDSGPNDIVVGPKFNPGNYESLVSSLSITHTMKFDEIH